MRSLRSLIAPQRGHSVCAEGENHFAVQERQAEYHHSMGFSGRGC